MAALAAALKLNPNSSPQTAAKPAFPNPESTKVASANPNKVIVCPRREQTAGTLTPNQWERQIRALHGQNG
jgi:hypothetical protein